MKSLPIAVLAVAWVFATAAPAAFGQSPLSGNYQPPQPIFSPWLNLYQHNTGALDNYHTYVQPEMQLRDTLQQQGASLQRQNTRLSLFEEQVSDLEKASGMHPTGVGSVYMSYSHFYPTLERRASGNAGTPFPARPRRPGPH